MSFRVVDGEEWKVRQEDWRTAEPHLDDVEAWCQKGAMPLLRITKQGFALVVKRVLAAIDAST